MARTKKVTEETENQVQMTPQEIAEKKIKYHKDCIEKLKAQQVEIERKIKDHAALIEKLENSKNNIKPSRKQMTDLLRKVDGMSMEEIAEKLGVKLD